MSQRETSSETSVLPMGSARIRPRVTTTAPSANKARSKSSGRRTRSKLPAPRSRCTGHDQRLGLSGLVLTVPRRRHHGTELPPAEGCHHGRVPALSPYDSELVVASLDTFGFSVL